MDSRTSQRVEVHGFASDFFRCCPVINAKIVAYPWDDKSQGLVLHHHPLIQETVTDSLGRFCIMWPKNELVTIRLKKEGYQTIQTTIMVPESGIHHHDYRRNVPLQSPDLFYGIKIFCKAAGLKLLPDGSAQAATFTIIPNEEKAPISLLHQNTHGVEGCTLRLEPDPKIPVFYAGIIEPATTWKQRCISFFLALIQGKTNIFERGRSKSSTDGGVIINFVDRFNPKTKENIPEKGEMYIAKTTGEKGEAYTDVPVIVCPSVVSIQGPGPGYGPTAIAKTEPEMRRRHGLLLPEDQVMRIAMQSIFIGIGLANAAYRLQQKKPILATTCLIGIRLGWHLLKSHSCSLLKEKMDANQAEENQVDLPWYDAKSIMITVLISMIIYRKTNNPLFTLAMAQLINSFSYRYISPNHCFFSPIKMQTTAEKLEKVSQKERRPH